MTFDASAPEALTATTYITEHALDVGPARTARRAPASGRTVVPALQDPRPGQPDLGRRARRRQGAAALRRARAGARERPSARPHQDLAHDRHGRRRPTTERGPRATRWFVARRARRSARRPPGRSATPTPSTPRSSPSVSVRPAPARATWRSPPRSRPCTGARSSASC